LGTQYFGTTIEETEALKIFNHAIDAGINFVDTADVYGGGESEIVVGKAIQGRREDVVLATKVFGSTGGGPNDGGLNRHHILSALEKSLERLKTDYIDIYLLHDPDYLTPIEETLRTLDVCVKSGKIRYIGCCNFYSWLLMEALGTSEKLNLEKFVCSQPLYNLANRDIEVELLPLCEKYGIGVTSYSPLARGVLAAKYHLGEKPPSDSRAGEGIRDSLRPNGAKKVFESQTR
jgi:aryl-alcohol dehydrogenase-like predicted oxidoreductase